MGWSIGYNSNWKRDIGYGVPAVCDHPKCKQKIDRGVSFVCGGFGSEKGCELYFCEKHLSYRRPRGEEDMLPFCDRCMAYRPPYEPKPDVPEWINHKMTDPSWEEWRKENSPLIHSNKR